MAQVERGLLPQVLALLLLCSGLLLPGVIGQGYWEIVKENAGIATMHAAVTHYGNVILLDRTNIGDSQLPLDNGRCRQNEVDRVSFGSSKLFRCFPSIHKVHGTPHAQCAAIIQFREEQVLTLTLDKTCIIAELVFLTNNGYSFLLMMLELFDSK